MFEVIAKKTLNEQVAQMDVRAPLTSKKALPGQFIILSVDEGGERIPLTINSTDPEAGTVRIVFQIVGKTTRRLNELEVGDQIHDFVGPLGKPSELDEYAGKRVAVIGGGLGTAIAFPQAKYLHEHGAIVDLICGFRSKDLIILEEDMKDICTNLIIMTDDGSNGNKGFTTTALQQQIDEGANYDLVLTIGPLVMMKFIAEVTRPHKIKTVVSMNSIMVDGTGMCGGCRLTVGGKMVFACVDGPDFDGHEVDFDEAIRRSKIFSKEEKFSDELHACKLTGEKHSMQKKNMSLKKAPMPEQDPKERGRNFSEVTLGYSEQTAMEEAHRCLQCKHKPCVQGCPVQVHIPEFIGAVAEGNFEEAYDIITATNALPAVCGRVCPQESQCERNCVRGVKGEPVAIGRLERFVADWHREHIDTEVEPPLKNGHKVAVVGAGPAGLSCAGDLARNGFDVTLFESFHVPGGVLMYGIPEFRLPKTIVQKEIAKLEQLGVKIETNMVIGRILTIDDLVDEHGFEAVFLGTGAGLPNFPDIAGINYNGVYSANEFLTRINLMKGYRWPVTDTPIPIGKHVAVLGGGNVAMDAARSALRLGAEQVDIIYRRSEDEMPARVEERHHAKEEGINFVTLNNPVEVLGNDEGWVTGLKLQKMELLEADATGRRAVRPIEGSEYDYPVDTFIVAIGQSPNPLIKQTTPDIEVNRWGCIMTGTSNTQTSRPGVFAGGDVVTGAATVILAMGAGKQAAKEIQEFISAQSGTEAMFMA